MVVPFVPPSLGVVSTSMLPPQKRSRPVCIFLSWPQACCPQKKSWQLWAFLSSPQHSSRLHTHFVLTTTLLMPPHTFWHTPAHVQLIRSTCSPPTRSLRCPHAALLQDEAEAARAAAYEDLCQAEDEVRGTCWCCMALSPGMALLTMSQS